MPSCARNTTGAGHRGRAEALARPHRHLATIPEPQRLIWGASVIIVPSCMSFHFVITWNAMRFDIAECCPLLFLECITAGHFAVQVTQSTSRLEDRSQAPVRCQSRPLASFKADKKAVHDRAMHREIGAETSRR